MTSYPWMHAVNQCKVVAPELSVWQEPACQVRDKHTKQDSE